MTLLDQITALLEKDENGYHKITGSQYFSQVEECLQAAHDEIKKLREALEFYADSKNYYEKIEDNNIILGRIYKNQGDLAREALRKDK